MFGLPLINPTAKTEFYVGTITTAAASLSLLCSGKWEWVRVAGMTILTNIFFKSLSEIISYRKCIFNIDNEYCIFQDGDNFRKINSTDLYKNGFFSAVCKSPIFIIYGLFFAYCAQGPIPKAISKFSTDKVFNSVMTACTVSYIAALVSAMCKIKIHPKRSISQTLDINFSSSAMPMAVGLIPNIKMSFINRDNYKRLSIYYQVLVMGLMIVHRVGLFTLDRAFKT